MDEPADPDRPDNLFETVPGHFAAHGRFDEESKSSSAISAMAEKVSGVLFRPKADLPR
jgi:hypothetical protein